MDILYDYQLEAVNKLNNGSILCGGVGSGKSRTSLAYYFKEMGGSFKNFEKCRLKDPLDLYIITTARKRDTMEWEGELSVWGLSTNPKCGFYNNKIIIDSWNNIKKYNSVKNAFFIFDEQRVIGNGAWVRSFLNITKNNKWILLSATPGDKWEEYIPVFIANGFYKNRSDFINQHVIFKRFSKFPQVDRYINVPKLVRLRKDILVDMTFKRKTVRHFIDVNCDYNRSQYDICYKERWNPFDKEPLINAATTCYTLRKIVNSDPSRMLRILDIYEKKKRLIIFYNYNYELDILRNLSKLDPGDGSFVIAEWNGQKHQEIPSTKNWIYLVQYTAGAEGWNCTKTDTIIFYSQNYSYKILEQSCGRIDRLNTTYTDLYYYNLVSKSKIDIAIKRVLKERKKFNESIFIGG